MYELVVAPLIMRLKSIHKVSLKHRLEILGGISALMGVVSGNNYT